MKDFVPLAELEDLVFGGWDIHDETLYESAIRNGVLERVQIDSLQDVLETIHVMPAAFDKHYVKKLDGTYIKKGKNKRDLAEQIMADIEQFIKTNNTDRNIMVWCGSTEIFIKQKDVHSTLAKFEAGMDNNDPDIAPSMLYA